MRRPVRAELEAVDGGGPAPVEYAVAVSRYLAQASLSPASRRVYAISLAGWAWPLVGAPVPAAADRRGARPPVVPLALLDAPGTAGKLAAAAAARAADAGMRTVNRELSVLRGAVAWWLDRGWISRDPTAGLRRRGLGPAALPALSGSQVAAVLGLPAGLREQALWRLLRDTGWPAGRVLALDASAVDLAARRVRWAGAAARPGPAAGPAWRPETGDGPAWRPETGGGPAWRPETGDLVRWLLAGRYSGPLFLTGRKAPAGTPAADVCAMTGRARMSYRRAAEIFTTRTRPLDPAGHGWTLHQLSAAGG
jgi:integrase